MSKGKILIVDDSESNAAVMAMHAEAEWENPIVTAKNAQDAISILNQHSDIITVVSDFNMEGGNGGDLYTFVKKEKPMIPFILIAGDDIDTFKSNPEFSDLFRDNPPAFISKPFEKEAFLEPIRKYGGQNLISAETQYKKIAIERFLMFNEVLVAAYIKLSQTKFVKILRSDDKFPEETVKKYIKKGVKHLFIETVEYEKFLNAAGKKIMGKLSNKKVGMKEKLEFQVHSVDSIHRGLRDLGMSKMAVTLADKSMDTTMNSLKKNKNISGLLSKLLLKRNYIYQLSMLTNYLSVAIAEKTDYGSPSSFKKLTMSALLQDLSLEKESLAKIINLHGEDFNKLKANEKKLVEGHPHRTIELLEKVDDFAADSRTIIMEHHERPTGKGFPRGINHLKIAPLSCVFIIAHQFAHRLLTEPLNTETFQDINVELKEMYGKGNFRKAYQGFVKAFKGEKK
jgi:response regulator RpfG family c-di-GMP phosphodiesterase